jgi:hypothetical protein
VPGYPAHIRTKQFKYYTNTIFSTASTSFSNPKTEQREVGLAKTKKPVHKKDGIER